MTMDERIEALMKVRRERPDEHSLWRTHYNILLNLQIPESIKNKIREQWNAMVLQQIAQMDLLKSKAALADLSDYDYYRAVVASSGASVTGNSV